MLRKGSGRERERLGQQQYYPYIVYGNLHETHGDRHVTVSNIPLMFYQFGAFTICHCAFVMCGRLRASRVRARPLLCALYSNRLFGRSVANFGAATFLHSLSLLLWA